MTACAARLLTPRGAGAIAVIELVGEVETALGRIGVGIVNVGDIALRDILGIDRGLVVRWSKSCAHLMPHGGSLIVQEMLDAIRDAGIEVSTGGDGAWPEAENPYESLMLSALSRAASSDAIDLLVAQPARWHAWDREHPTRAEIETFSRTLNRLIEPPTIAMIGLANVGKSTLMNALADRAVSVVSDEPGTTRDHVGVTLDLGGLVVRWIDTPGLRNDSLRPEEEREAAQLAASVLRAADLIVVCGDAEHGFPSGSVSQDPILIGTRGDLGMVDGIEITTAAGTDSRGQSELVQKVRERLIPAETLAWNGPWAFDRRLFGP